MEGWRVGGLEGWRVGGLEVWRFGGWRRFKGAGKYAVFPGLLGLFKN